MFVCVFAGQVFAAGETEVVATDDAKKDVATEVVINEEIAKAEATAVYKQLKEDGLTDGQIVAVVEEALKSETTENEYRSVLKKSNREKIVWMLVGATAFGVAILGVKYGIPAVRSIYANLTAEKVEAPVVQPVQVPVVQVPVVQAPVVQVSAPTDSWHIWPTSWSFRSAKK